MNMLILDPGESGILLPATDRRCGHLARILHRGEGESVIAGCTDGSTGEARILRLDSTGLVLEYLPRAVAPELHPLSLILGFPRPIQAARILKDLCSLGIGEILLTGTDLGEKSYIQSNFFKNAEYRRALLEGAEQAASPRIPGVTRYWTLDRCLEDVANSDAANDRGQSARRTKVAFHPDARALPFGSMQPAPDAATGGFLLAVGSERGWTVREVALLKGAGFRLASLGSRILKTETAAEAAVILSLAKLGLL